MKELLGISEGNYFSLLLLSDGSVYSYGDNFNSELGLGEKSLLSTNTPKLIPSLPFVKQIAAGMAHSVALTNNGLVFAWGKNNFGQVALEIRGNVKSPVQIRPLKNIQSVSAAIGYSLALDANGTVWQWGSDTTREDSPLQKPTGLQNIVWIGAADTFSLALNNQGELYWWSPPSYSPLGPFAPTLPEKFSFDKKIIAVSVGVCHALFQTENGNVYGFGENYAAQLGDTLGVQHPNIPIKLNLGNVRDVK